MVHERRRFTDVMDEEIDEERRHRTFIDKYTVGFIRSRMETCSLDIPRRLKLEIPARLAIREESRAVKEDATFGTPPFFREKPNTCAITEGTPLALTALISGSPEPVVQWFKNDNILGEVTSPRISIKNDKGRSTLTYSETRDFDTGLYKVVARNNLGQVTHKFRLVQGHLPGPCDTPDVTQVSDTEALVRWRPPIDDGGSQTLCYHLQMRRGGDAEWSTLAENIDHEFYLAGSLTPDTPYQFRIKANNFIGWGDFSASTAPSKSAAPGTEKVEMSQGMMYLQRQTEAGKKVQQWQEGRELDYSKEQDPVKIKTGENAELQVRKYNPVAEWGRGRYSLVAKCVRSDDHRHFALKVLTGKAGRENQVKDEVEVLRSLRHERIAQLYESYSLGSVTVLVMEPLAGVDVVTFLASQYQYSEQQIYTVVTQVLDALSYLHWRGYCHLDLQPDNIVLTSTRRCDVKLIDLGSAQKVSKAGSPITLAGHLEYMAPEVLLEQRGYPSSDIWSLGVVTYALLAGASAFAGLEEEETKTNIQYVRYKFEHLSPATTQEAIRFLMLIFKRDPSKRPTVDECRDHKWMVESDFTTKKRERAVFFGTRLREYDQTYHRARAASATKLADLLNFNDAAFPPTISYDPDMLGDL